MWLLFKNGVLIGISTKMNYPIGSIHLILYACNFACRMHHTDLKCDLFYLYYVKNIDGSILEQNFIILDWGPYRVSIKIFGLWVPPVMQCNECMVWYVINASGQKKALVCTLTSYDVMTSSGDVIWRHDVLWWRHDVLPWHHRGSYVTYDLWIEIWHAMVMMSAIASTLHSKQKVG